MRAGPDTRPTTDTICHLGVTNRVPGTDQGHVLAVPGGSLRPFIRRLVVNSDHQLLFALFVAFGMAIATYGCR